MATHKNLETYALDTFRAALRWLKHPTADCGAVRASWGTYSIEAETDPESGQIWATIEDGNGNGASIAALADLHTWTDADGPNYDEPVPGWLVDVCAQLAHEFDLH